MRYQFLWIALISTALVAGCTDGGEEAGEGEGELGSDVIAPTNNTVVVPLEFAAVGPDPLAAEGGAIEVEPEATALLVEARWECTSPTCEMTMAVVGPEGEVVAEETGDGEASLTVEQPAAGEYSLVFAADEPVAGVTGEARATTFTGVVPPGFTAWNETA